MFLPSNAMQGGLSGGNCLTDECLMIIWNNLMQYNNGLLVVVPPTFYSGPKRLAAKSADFDTHLH